MSSTLGAVNEIHWMSTPILIPALLSMFTIIGVYLWDQSRDFVKLGNKIPGPYSLPFIGNALIVLGKTNHQIVEMAMELSNYFGNVIRIWLGRNLFVFLTDPDDVEVILNSNEHIDKSPEYRYFKPWLGDGLLISSGERWKSHRKLIAPAFHINVLKSFVNIFNKNSMIVVDRLKTETGKVFDVHDYMSEITVDILIETAMGTKRSSKNGEGYDYAMAVMKMCDIIHQRHYKLYYRYDVLFNMTGLRDTQEKLLGIIHGLTNKVIKQKNKVYEDNLKEGIVPSPSLQEIVAGSKKENPQQQRETKNVTKHVGLRDDLDDIDEFDVGEKRRLAFLDLMIETKHSGEMIDDHDIKEEVDTIMFEGHDTTAAGSSFALCLLGIHQNIQDKVYEELRQIFGDSNRPATFADTLEMKYLERVIMETLRMYPPVPIIARQVQRDVKLPSGYTLPGGCSVVVGTFKMHRRGDLYSNPLVFDPDNFLPERTQNRHYYSYVPFSAGPRSCVGRKYAMLKLKILLSTILRNYHIKSKLSEKDFKLQGDIILKRADGFRLEIEPRVK